MPLTSSYCRWTRQITTMLRRSGKFVTGELIMWSLGINAHGLTPSIRRVLQVVTGKAIPKGTKMKLDAVDSIRMGTTVSTNALLERQGERCALLTTKGYRDIMKIGMQGAIVDSVYGFKLTAARPSIFDLSIEKLSFLYEEVVEVRFE